MNSLFVFGMLEITYKSHSCDKKDVITKIHSSTVYNVQQIQTKLSLMKKYIVQEYRDVAVMWTSIYTQRELF